MLKKYTLIHVPSGGVDHLLNGVRVRIDHRLTDEQAEELLAAGLPYFQEISKPINSPIDGIDQSTKSVESGRTGAKRNRKAGGQFAKVE